MSHSIFKMLIKASQKSLSKEAIAYLKSRNITKDMAKKWEIGYVPSEQLLLDLEGDKTPLYKEGILIGKINKTPLNEYISFPMYNQYGDVIGFSGRPPLSNEAVKRRKLKKYWHSKLDKKNFLFGMHHAVESAREQDYMIVVEGQFDVIIPSTAGIKNIVGTCGTALTENQVILLSRYVNKAYVVFDNDDAGKKAIAQLEKYDHIDIELIPIFLPDTEDAEGNVIKEDPDSFIRKYGKDKFLECVLGE